MFNAAVRLAHDALATRRLLRENAELRAEVHELRQIAEDALQLAQTARVTMQQHEGLVRELKEKIARLERPERPAERDTE